MGQNHEYHTIKEKKSPLNYCLVPFHSCVNTCISIKKYSNKYVNTENRHVHLSCLQHFVFNSHVPVINFCVFKLKKDHTDCKGLCNVIN